MKRTISFIMAVLMLCDLCVPAFAESVSMVVTPTKNSDGNYEITLTEPGNYFITKSCEVYSLFIKNCTLTIAEGVTIRVTRDIYNIDGVLNIGSGAVLEYSGKDLTNSGTMNVYGTVNAYSQNFMNNGTMNVHGTVDISRCNNCNNHSSGTINIYPDGSIIGSEKIRNRGTINDNLICSEDHTVCNHAFADNHICIMCGKTDCELGLASHTWDNGICTSCGFVDETKHVHDYTSGDTTSYCKCGKACPHAELDNGFCTVCDYFVGTGHIHDFTNGTCKCGEACPHDELDNGFCTVCDFLADKTKHTHDFTTGDTVGYCKCGDPCPHESWTKGACDACHFVCPHGAELDNGFCTVCGILADKTKHTHNFTSGDSAGYCKCGDPCPHENTTTTCNDCNMEIAAPGTGTASTLSEGSVTVVLCIACAVVFGLGGFILGKKKKPSDEIHNS